MRKLTVLLWLCLVLLFCDRIESRTANVLNRRVKRAVFPSEDQANGITFGGPFRKKRETRLSEDQANGITFGGPFRKKRETRLSEDQANGITFGGPFRKKRETRLSEDQANGITFGGPFRKKRETRLFGRPFVNLALHGEGGARKKRSHPRNDFGDGYAGGRRKRYAETLRLGDTAVSSGRPLTRTRRGYLWTDLAVETPWAKHLAQRAKRR